MTTGSNVPPANGIEIDACEPWERITIAEVAAKGRANLAAAEAQAHARIRELFAELEAKLELDLVRMAADAAIQRGETH